MNPPQSRPAVDVEVTTRGAVSQAAPGYARAKVGAVLGRIHEPVLGVRVKLTQEAHHAIVRPSVAQVVVDLDGRPVRAQVAAATMQEAVDLFVFFTDAATGRGNVLYHRYDGHYGLVTPTAA
ncbi:sigma 54 modulation/S30EA ribosomal C-terminal domain-containing protein [Kitasatospora sp. NPDC048722]|uniref:sigma 54 modulation/S30EA ribosomal C-terminal domain-containing protein n=1 Tax=Kitasatospora sp. NPDC048722 TaxID=3155639 RepID=UPI0033E63DFF